MSAPRPPDIPRPVSAPVPVDVAPVLPGDALAGADGTQEPPPLPPFDDAVAGLLTGELPPLPAGPPPLPPALRLELDDEAIARAARELAAEPVRRPRTTHARRQAAPHLPAAAGRPSPVAPAKAAPSTAAPRRHPVVGWLIALLVLGILGFNLIREVIAYIVRIVH